jgi:hypothetical protein
LLQLHHHQGHDLPQDAKSVSLALTPNTRPCSTGWLFGRFCFLTLRDVYFGRGNTILLERERIKRQTIQSRRLMHTRKAA